MNNTRKLTTMALLAAVSVALVALIHFPLIPAAPFLEYDPADIPILICGFAFGVPAGLAVTLIASVIQGLTVSAASGIYGIIMHVIATGTYVTVTGLIYRRKPSKKTAAIAIAAGIISMAAIMIPANLLITPLFTGWPVKSVANLLLPGIIPFNLAKAGINGAITFVVYKGISKLIKMFHAK
ncbi:MAG: ECF transporter S component [Clostridia bacterium]|nr:ECF transporter S component [Clostridia bacterium]